MRALSIRQPFAELILRGIKTAELRSRATTIVGERFYIYASRGATKRRSDEATKGIWSRDLATGENPPEWMIELAAQVKLIEPELLRGAMLPTGVIVGSAIIESVEEVAGCELLVAGGKSKRATNNPQLATIYRWHLTDVQRAKRLRKPTGHPQPVWFRPFD